MMRALQTVQIALAGLSSLARWFRIPVTSGEGDLSFLRYA